MSNWYDYQWDLSGQPAWFHVDLDYMEEFDHLGDFTTLLHVTCMPNKEKSNFRHSDYRQLEKVLADCCQLLGEKAVYVGSIEYPSQRRYYFYTADPRLFVPLLKYSEQNSHFQIFCDKATELNRQTYYRLLVPDTAQRQASNNLSYIESLASRGDDTKAPRRVNLHFYFPTGTNREAFSTAAKEIGFAIGKGDYVPERELPYYLSIHQISPLQITELTELTTKAIRAAEEYGGILEHFDSAFVPIRHNL